MFYLIKIQIHIAIKHQITYTTHSNFVIQILIIVIQDSYTNRKHKSMYSSKTFFSTIIAIIFLTISSPLFAGKKYGKKPCVLEKISSPTSKTPKEIQADRIAELTLELEATHILETHPDPITELTAELEATHISSEEVSENDTLALFQCLVKIIFSNLLISHGNEKMKALYGELFAPRIACVSVYTNIARLIKGSEEASAILKEFKEKMLTCLEPTYDNPTFVIYGIMHALIIASTLKIFLDICTTMKKPTLHALKIFKAYVQSNQHSKFLSQKESSNEIAQPRNIITIVSMALTSFIQFLKTYAHNSYVNAGVFGIELLTLSEFMKAALSSVAALRIQDLHYLDAMPKEFLDSSGTQALEKFPQLMMGETVQTVFWDQQAYGHYIAIIACHTLALLYNSMTESIHTKNQEALA
jgi:hypothetical protein